MDIHILGLGQHRNGRRGGMDTPARFGFRYPLYSVHTGFELEAGKHVFAFYMYDRLLDAAKLALLLFDQVETPAMSFGIALIHA